jgi:nucleoside-diphosphate-sugar epimerase
MKIVVIGDTGHIGSYLIPMLVAAGHQVTVVSRGVRSPYTDNNVWKNVRMVELNRKEADATHAFGHTVKNLSPDIIMDLICYSPESFCDLIEMLRGRIMHLLVCGTIWIHGPSSCVPVKEEDDRTPFGAYGI